LFQREHQTKRKKNKPKFFSDEWVNYQQSNPTQKISASILNMGLFLDWKKTINDVDSQDLLRFLREADYHINSENSSVEWQHPMEKLAWANTEYNTTWEEAICGSNKDDTGKQCKLSSTCSKTIWTHGKKWIMRIG
jgi:hypothetical protein